MNIVILFFRRNLSIMKVTPYFYTAKGGSMSAIWGMVALESNTQLPPECRTIFEQTYRNSCKIDRYEGIEITDAYFGCGIQYITEEAPKECLPIYNKEKGLLFTADCILDNRDDIISLLLSKGHSKEELIETPDGGLMYLSFLEFGEDCVKDFRGLFSIAVRDETAHTLTIFSDPVSARSLYYTHADGLVAFSTRAEPLRKLFSVTPNENYHKDFLLSNTSVIYLVPGETPYNEIFLLPPATKLCFTEKEQTSAVYRTAAEAAPHAHINPQKCTAHFLQLYQDCVKDALRTSGEIGITLSSGLDSSSVGVLAAKELVAYGKTLHSYTFTPYRTPDTYRENNYILDESVPVRDLVKMYPNISATFLNNQGKNLFEDMSFCSGLLEMPYKTGVFPNHYEMCVAASGAGCKVLLNGAFGNNTVSFGHISNGLYDLYRKKRTISFRSLLRRYTAHEGINPKEFQRRILKRFQYYEQRPKEFLSTFVPENIFVTRSILRNYDLCKRHQADPRATVSGGFLCSSTYSDFLQATALLMYMGVFETQFGLSTGMLLRDPTKDIRMIEFCRQIPFSVFTHNGTPRQLIRGAFSSTLPKSILEPWEQHGILNADWSQRIKRDWQTLKPELLQHLDSDILNDWIDKERLRLFITTFDPASEQNTAPLVHMCSIEGLLRFLPQKKT